MANKLALEAGIGCRLLLKNPVIVWLIRHVAWRAGRDVCSPFRRIFGKPYDGSICKFGEQVHCVFRVVSNRVGSWGKMELTDERLLGTLAGIRSSRKIYRLPKSQCYCKDALDRIAGTPTNPRPDGVVRDPVVRRQYITQKWLDVTH